MKFAIPDDVWRWPVECWMMKNEMKRRYPFLMAQATVAMVLLAVAGVAVAQAPMRFLGTITAISGNTLTVKTDADGIHTVNVPAGAPIKRIAPGQKDLSTAEAIQFSDLAVGDRALVKLDPDAPAGAEEALQIIAVKQADVALRQQKDREDWQRRGVGGLVKRVDAVAGVIVLTSGSGATAKAITVHTTKTTMLKRYAPASVRYDAALPAPIDAVHAGDQLLARGKFNAEGTEIAAEEVISGAFRNISGTIASLDAAGSTLVVKDLATKKPVTIHIPPDAQMRRLPDRMAQILAAQLKGSSGLNETTQSQYDASNGLQRGGAGRWGGGQGGNSSWSDQGGGQTGGNGRWGARGSGSEPASPGSSPNADPQQLLNRAPVIQLGDLKKGEAVMLVSTEGTTEVTAITLLAGVEPLLEAPAASKDLLSNWSMNSGAGAAEAAAQ
jgi:hypothetical protein